MSPPRNKDKFAALAQHQQEKEQQQQQEPEPPSQPHVEISVPEVVGVAEAAELVTEAVEAEAPVVQPVPVKRDKFASMSAHQAAVGAAPKRDKFASMAAHRSGETPPTTPPETVATSGPIDMNLGASALEPPSAAVVTAAAPPRRDKFASMASRQQTGAGTTSDSVTTVVVVTLDQSQQEAEEKRNRSLQQRMDQRDAVWSDLCKAEAQTIKLLQTAQTTATHLAAAASYNNNDDNDSKSTNTKSKNTSDATGDPDTPSGSQVTAIQKCMKDYQSTVEQIHALLAPHADLVKAYQAPTRLNRMYQARVELRLAEEKRQVTTMLYRSASVSLCFMDRSHLVVLAKFFLFHLANASVPFQHIKGSCCRSFCGCKKKKKQQQQQQQQL